MNYKMINRIVALVEGNPGAIRVCTEIFENFGDIGISLLEAQAEFRGSAIWILYKDECGEDVFKMFDTLLKGTALEKLRANTSRQYEREQS